MPLAIRAKMIPFKKSVRRLCSPLVQHCFRLAFFDRLIDALVYEQKRFRRRVIEDKLRAEGKYPDEIVQGPLKGTKFPPGYASCRFEKIIGTYEFETHSWLEELVSRGGFTSIVNIGAAEGSYSAGIGRCFSEVPIYAFEANADLHPRILQMAELNNILDRLHLYGRCEPGRLSTLEVGKRPLVVCDVEGYEVELLRPSDVTWLRFATLFVELHDCIRAGSTEDVCRRFADTHNIRRVSRGLDYFAYPALEGLSFPEIYAMVLEDRPAPQEWMLAEPR